MNVESNIAKPENQIVAACPHCGGRKLYAESRPPHVALVCQGCSRWIQWIPKSRATEYPTKPAIKDSPTVELAARREQSLPAPAPEVCNHTQQLDLLLESMNRCNRHLEIITRAMIKGVAR